ncbi:transposase [Pelagibius sp. 7325]|uniref:transposase n=1 Tax=Pelagibius sp. 7325 TaxID=3131994 RepID=UPI0030EC536A
MPRFSRRSKFAIPFENDGSVHPQFLPYRNVETLRRHPVLATLAGKTIVASRLCGAYHPDSETRNRELAEGSVYLGDVLVRVYGPTIGGVPTETYIFVPVYEEPAKPGEKPLCKALFPAGIDPETGVDETLVSLLERELAYHSIQHCRWATLAPRSVIEAVAESLPTRQRQALKDDGFEVTFIGIDGVKLNQQVGTNRGALNATASNPALGIHFPLLLTDMKKGHRSKTAARLARAILELARPDDPLAIVTDYGLEDRAIAAMAVKMAQARCPGLDPYFVIDRFHIQKAFADAFNEFRIETHQSLARDRFGRKRKRLSKERLKKIKAIKRAAKALCTTRWSTLEMKPRSKALVKAAFEASADLEAAFWLLEELRQIFDCRTLAEAEARYAAWKEKLKASGLDCFDAPANNLEREWDAVKTYFVVLEILDACYPGLRCKVGTNHAENFNKEAKAVWRDARRSSIARLEQRLIARRGYLVQARSLRLLKDTGSED